MSAATAPAQPVTSPRLRTAFHVVAVAEALSWAGLLIGMLVKYALGGNELGVQVFGPIHGAIFVAYLVVALVVSRPLRWRAGTLALALAASVPPLGTLAFDVWARRTGRL